NGARALSPAERLTFEQIGERLRSAGLVAERSLGIDTSDPGERRQGDAGKPDASSGGDSMSAADADASDTGGISAFGSTAAGQSAAAAGSAGDAVASSLEADDR